MIQATKLKRLENLSRVAVREERLTGTNLKLTATRDTGSIHRHHRVNSQSQSIDTSTKLCIQCLLRVVTLLTDTSTPETARNHVPSKSNHWSVLHHVRVLFHLEQLTAVHDDNNSLYILTVIVLTVFVIGKVFHVFFVFVLIVFLRLHEQLFRNQTVVLGQTNLVVREDSQLFVSLKVSVRIRGFHIHITVDTILNGNLNLMLRDKLINRNTQCFLNVGSNRVNQEVVRQDGTKLNHSAVINRDTHCLHSTIHDGLRSRFHLFDFFNHQLTDTSTVDSTVQDTLSDRAPSLGVTEVFEQLLSEISNVFVLWVFTIITDVKPLTTTKRSFFNLRDSRLNCLLQCRVNQL